MSHARSLSLRLPIDANHDVSEEISICCYILFRSALQWFLSSIDRKNDCKSLLTCDINQHQTDDTDYKSLILLTGKLIAENTIGIISLLQFSYNSF